MNDENILWEALSLLLADVLRMFERWDIVLLKLRVAFCLLVGSQIMTSFCVLLKLILY